MPERGEEDPGVLAADVDLGRKLQELYLDDRRELPARPDRRQGPAGLFPLGKAAGLGASAWRKSLA